jgi:hypothetical protein
MQAGIMEEMLDDTLEGLDEDPELEEEAEEEVERVLYEITDGKLGVAGAGKELPVRSEVFSALHYWILTRTYRTSTTPRWKQPTIGRWHGCKLS